MSDIWLNGLAIYSSRTTSLKFGARRSAKTGRRSSRHATSPVPRISHYPMIEGGSTMSQGDAMARQAFGGAISLFEEFKAFALKGNVVDLAIGVIIGTAFGKVVSAMVTHVLMPIATWPLQKAGGAEELTKALAWQLGSEKNVLDLGAFINEVVSFIIIAAALFIFIVKFLGWI